ncbi:GDSL-type esterase/lipase family protein [Streptomyces sp. MAR4 CNY-716]
MFTPLRLLASAALLLAFLAPAPTYAASSAAAPVPGSRPVITETPNQITVTASAYSMTVTKSGFRYGFAGPDGKVTLPPHAESGLRVRADGADAFADAVDTRLVNKPSAATAVLNVTLSDDSVARVQLHPTATTVRLKVEDVDEPATIDLRTGPVDGPAYGLGDHGSIENGQPVQGTPCSGKVEARSTTDLRGLELDNITNQGSCKRFVSTFTVFPAQGTAEVLFDEGQKRFGLNESENRLGVDGADGVDALHYLLGGDLKQVYADYRELQRDHGYQDVLPNPRMFELGWEAYGALGWNTYQESVMKTVKGFADHGYPLKWGVVGSGFWPGPRGVPTEGTTNSFGMWDDTFEPGREDAQPGLPNPRYPDPDSLKRLFAENDMSLLLGARNNFPATKDDGGNYNPVTDGPFVPEAMDEGYLVKDDDDSPTVLTRTQFPSGASYVLDGSNAEAVDWFVDRSRAWGVDGFKEDAMLYEPDLHLDGNWNPLQEALHDDGNLMMVRNAAYAVPGDVLRINDTIYGTGDVYHEDPDRMPVNLLNMAASGAANLSPDIIGGTPGPSLSDPAYQSYFMRNAQFNAMAPVMTFGKGPWELGRSDYAASVKKLALWHDALHPYIYDAVVDGHESGFPHAMTPLPIAYPDDPNTYDLANDKTRQYEWMLGESLLATPVFGSDFETATSRDVYLPAGKWIDVSTGATFTGPTTLQDYAIGTDRVPAFAGGKGVVVTRGKAGMRAEVYPIATDSTYEWTNGSDRSAIVNANTGWDPESLVITDTTTGKSVKATLDQTTGAIRFPITPGHDYKLTGGGDAAHSIPLPHTAPASAPDPVAVVTDDAGTSLSWPPVDDARHYVVEVDGSERCLSGVVGSTDGTTLPLGTSKTGGTYTVSAVNELGSGPASKPVTVAPTDNGSAVVTVTDEGSPPRCDPDRPAYAESGTWQGSSLSGFDGTKSRFTRTGGDTATWTADLATQTYDVSVWFPRATNSAAEVTYTVHHADGDTDVSMPQADAGDAWLSLGEFDFTDSEPASVTITAGDGVSRTDAVRFTPAVDDPPHPGTGTWTASSSLLEDITISGQTVRNVVHTSIGGSGLRIRLTNAFGQGPVKFGSVTVGAQKSGADLLDGSVRDVTFGGASAITIPVGGSAVSDPVDGTWEPESDVVVSAYVPDDVQTVTGHLRPTATSYLGDGDHTADTDGAAYTGELNHWLWLDRVSFDSTDAGGAVAVMGDSLTDGGGDIPDTNLRWTDHLARRILRELPADEQMGVLNAGMSGNRILYDGYGPRALDRLDRDVLDQPGVRTLLLFQGINDVSRSVTAAGPLIDGLDEIINRAKDRGLRVVVATLAPFEGSSTYTEEKESVRQAVNAHIRDDSAADAVVDFDIALADPEHPLRLAPHYDKGDHLHLSDAGRERLAEVVDLSSLRP